MKKQNELEYRMYGLVPYNISEIQKGIQFGHALQEFNNDIINESLIKVKEAFDKWRCFDKTFIILNGGTTNKNKESDWYGTMNQHKDTLTENGILNSWFYEPDLGEQLTAIVFLVDERVFDKETYPDFINFMFENYDSINNKK